MFGRNDAKAETPVLWPPHAKSWLIGKDSDVGRDWGQEEKGMTEDEMVGWHQRRESEWTPGVGVGEGGLACCNSWGRKEVDTTEQLNWTEDILSYIRLSFHRLFILDRIIMIILLGIILCTIETIYDRLYISSLFLDVDAHKINVWFLSFENLSFKVFWLQVNYIKIFD